MQTWNTRAPTSTSTSLAAESLVAAKENSEQADSEIVVQRKAYIRKADADRQRLRELQYLGIRVIPVTGFDLSDVRRMDQMACALAKGYLRVARWCESRPEDIPPLGEDCRDSRAKRVRRKRQGSAKPLQLLPASHWESWLNSLDDHAYRTARENLLQELEQGGRQEV